MRQIFDLPNLILNPLFFEFRAQYPLYFGTAIYAFEGIGVVLPLENQMRTPRDMRGWNGVLNTSMTIVTCLYIAVGFFGYLKYGESVQGSITLNLPVDQWYVLCRAAFGWHKTFINILLIYRYYIFLLSFNY